MIPFLIQKQAYKCTLIEGLDDDLQQLEGDHEAVCTQENICAGDERILAWEVDYSNDRSLNNWVQQLDLMCESDWKGGFIGTAFYFSWCLALLFVPRYADKVGRKWLFLGSRLVECGLFLGTLITRNYWVMVGLLACLGVAAAGRLNVGTVYLTEWFPRKN